MRLDLEKAIRDEMNFWRILSTVRDNNVKTWHELTVKETHKQMMQLGGGYLHPKFLMAKLEVLNGGDRIDQKGHEWRIPRLAASEITMGNIAMPGPGSLNAVAVSVKRAIEQALEVEWARLAESLEKCAEEPPLALHTGHAALKWAASRFRDTETMRALRAAWSPPE